MIQVLSKRPRLAFVALVIVLGSFLSWYSGIALPWTLLIAAGAILLNGLVATLEDDLPGGFNNPDGSGTPQYVHRVRWTGGLLTFVVAFAVFTAARRGALDMAPGLLFALASMSLGLALVSRRRLFQWSAIVLVLVAFAFAIWRGGMTSNKALQPRALDAVVKAECILLRASASKSNEGA
jgi:hypothetical protein